MSFITTVTTNLWHDRACEDWRRRRREERWREGRGGREGVSKGERGSEGDRWRVSRWEGCGKKDEEKE